MKIDLKQNITITKKSIIIAYEINSIVLVPNTSATISLFVYCDDNTLEQKIFILVEKAYDDYINDEYLYNYIDKNIEQIFINN